MHLVIPFASALPEAAAQAAGTLALPHLERLLARWADEDADPILPAALPADGAEYTLSLPHERVVAQARGWPVVDGLLPFAAEEARRDGLAPAAGSGWGRVTPSHWHVGRDEIHLLDPASLALDDSEEAGLHAALAPLFEDLGWRWLRAAGGRWYASHPSLAEVPTASIDRVIGRNVDLWLTDHPAALQVRRLQSEVQMLLYVHPLNDAREARGLPPVNSFWLGGTGPAPAAGASPSAGIVVDERLRAPALAEDWSAWAEAWRALDAGPLRELAHAAPDAPHRLTLAGERTARGWRPQARPWWKRLLGGSGPGLAAVLGAL
jgi:hypothetical protein